MVGEWEITALEFELPGACFTTTRMEAVNTSDINRPAMVSRGMLMTCGTSTSATPGMGKRASSHIVRPTRRGSVQMKDPLKYMAMDKKKKPSHLKRWNTLTNFLTRKKTKEIKLKDTRTIVTPLDKILEDGAAGKVWKHYLLKKICSVKNNCTLSTN